ncbi:MAG: MBL fold metallo-hydrolase [Candidatus Edwardsbacteria bacterium]|nr:MBL fold metallo-hydrolase [Candidatus Edwardsbacteria bacterium]
MQITYYGVRGSIPAPGADTSRYGGNTTCAEVITASGQRLIIDCGTGIRKLGLKLLTEKNVPEIPIFITHVHWDHIQGLPFFLPIYMGRFKLRFLGAKESFGRLYSTLYDQMDGYVFPAKLQEVQSDTNFHEVDAGEPVTYGDAKFEIVRNNHPVPTYGVKISENGKSFVFMTDNELRDEKPHTGYDTFVKFCAGADLLIHDAQYTENEIKSKRGWGHSTFLETIKLAEDAGVKSLGFFHHEPERTDDQLDAIVKEMKGKTKISVFGTKEGEPLKI